MIELLLILLAIGALVGLVGLAFYVFAIPAPFQRLIVGVAVLLGVLLVLGYLGVPHAPRPKSLWSAVDPVATAYAQDPIALEPLQPAPGADLKATLMAFALPLLLAVFGAAIQWARKLGQDASLARTKAQREQAQLEEEQAERSKQRAKEERAAGKLTGAQAQDIAVKDFLRRVPGATDESARSAILASVGADPELGASRTVTKGGAS